jgi:hypothetical protein
MSQPQNSTNPALQGASNQSPPPSLETLPPAQALELFITDPFAFVRQIVEDAAKTHLSDLKEEAELKNALSAFRKKSSEFQRFEPFILQEVVTLLKEDPEGSTASWETLLEKATVIFGQKFEATLQAKMENEDAQTNKAIAPPHMEAAANRAPITEPPSFTRKQIANMSLPEFLKKEAAINEAIQNNRIH